MLHTTKDLNVNDVFDITKYPGDGWYYAQNKEGIGNLIYVGVDGNFPNAGRTLLSIPFKLDYAIENGIVEEVKEEVQELVTQHSEDFLLKLVAVFQKPELIKDIK